MKKKIIIGISIVVVAIIAILAFLFIQDKKQEDKLKEEITKLNELSNASELDIDKINEILDRTITTGDYKKVEESTKQYLKDILDLSINIANELDDEQLISVLTADNYKNDGPDFINTKAYISKTKESMQNYKQQFTDFMSDEKVMSYINDKKLDSYYNDFYKEQVMGDTDKKSVEDINASIDQILNMLNVYDETINFLIANKGKWTIDSGQIVFNTDELIDEYNTLLNKLG